MNKYKNNFSFWGLLIFMFEILCSCTSENVGVDKKIIDSVLINDENSLPINVVSDGALLDSFSLRKNFLHRFGSEFTQFHRLGENLLIVNDYTSEAICTDGEGNFLWRAVPPSPEKDRYDVIGTVEVDSKAREVYLEDRMQQRIDVFGFTGEHLRTIGAKAAFIEFELLGKDEFLFDVSDAPQYILPDHDVLGPKRFLLQKGEEIKVAFPLSTPVNENSIVVNNGYRFNRVEGNLQHRRPFEDTLYSVFKQGEAFPLLHFAFGSGTMFREVYENQSVELPWEKLANEGYPNPYLVVHNEATNITSVAYQKNERRYFVRQLTGGSLASPSSLYQIEDLLIFAPKFYSDGWFYQQLFRYQFNYLQEAAQLNYTEARIFNDLAELDTKYGDDDDVIIVAVKFD